MNKIYIKITNRRMWILDYHFICASFFIPLTIYGSIKLRNIRLTRKKKLERERAIKKLQKLHRILRAAGCSSLSTMALLKILALHAGDDVIVEPLIKECLDLDAPSYVDDERILRFLNDKFSKLHIKGIIYITKQALCYLVENEGLVDFPIVFLERIKIDGVYSFIKTFSEWAVLSIAATLGISGMVQLQLALVFGGYAWLSIHTIEILKPHVKDVNKLTGKYVPRIETRKDAIVFDAKKEPIPPMLEKSVKPLKITTLDTEYEITEEKLVDVSKVSKLKNKFSDRVFKRPNGKRKKTGKTVYFSQMIKKWTRDQNDKEIEKEAISLIDKMIQEEII